MICFVQNNFGLFSAFLFSQYDIVQILLTNITDNFFIFIETVLKMFTIWFENLTTLLTIVCFIWFTFISVLLQSFLTFEVFSTPITLNIASESCARFLVSLKMCLQFEGFLTFWTIKWAIHGCNNTGTQGEGKL